MTPDCIFYAFILLLACVLYVHYVHPARACMVHAVYVYLSYLLAAQRRMQPSRDTVYFVVRM